MGCSRCSKRPHRIETTKEPVAVKQAGVFGAGVQHAQHVALGIGVGIVEQQAALRHPAVASVYLWRLCRDAAFLFRGEGNGPSESQETMTSVQHLEHLNDLLRQFGKRHYHAGCGRRPAWTAGLGQGASRIHTRAGRHRGVDGALGQGGALSCRLRQSSKSGQ